MQGVLCSDSYCILFDVCSAPNYCFKDAEVKVCEQSGVLEFTLENTGIPVTDCVTFSTTAGTAISMYLLWNALHFEYYIINCTVYLQSMTFFILQGEPTMMWQTVHAVLKVVAS